MSPSEGRLVRVKELLHLCEEPLVHLMHLRVGGRLDLVDDNRSADEHRDIGTARNRQKEAPPASEHESIGVEMKGRS